MQLARLIGPELKALLEESPAELQELLDDIHPEDVADVIEELERDHAAKVLESLPTEYAAQVFERLDDPVQESLAEAMGVEVAAELAVEMDTDDLADFVDDLPPEMSLPLIKRLEELDAEVATEVRELRQWQDTSAGGLMTTDYLWVEPGLTVQGAMEEIRKQAVDAETLDAIYVVDSEDLVKGYLRIRDVLLADPMAKVEEVMRLNLISVPPEMDQEDVARTLGKYDMNTLPVVDERGVILGVITADDILDVLAEEQSEDVHKMGAIDPLSETYFETSLLTFVKKRAPWLLVLFVGGFFTATAIQHFDGVLASIAHLSFYLPMLISAGGNSGSQSSTLITRGLAVGDVHHRDWWRVLARELSQGLILGGTLGAVGALRVVVAGENSTFALLVAVTLVSIVVMGCVVGGMMPLLLSRIGLDPATSSTPFIATLVDVLGIMIYLGLARWLLLESGMAAFTGSG
ncbi:MAG: magnesium transporter [Polyangiaceae bacterium]|nr:magnesium transporter [Polyangiaceae bacterium]MCB9607433.1 magnesium transporter [Polyangiaceae bacterium]